MNSSPQLGGYRPAGQGVGEEQGGLPGGGDAAPLSEELEGGAVEGGRTGCPGPQGFHEGETGLQLGAR